MKKLGLLLDKAFSADASQRIHGIQIHCSALYVRNFLKDIVRRSGRI